MKHEMTKFSTRILLWGTNRIRILVILLMGWTPAPKMYEILLVIGYSPYQLLLAYFFAIIKNTCKQLRLWFLLQATFFFLGFCPTTCELFRNLYGIRAELKSLQIQTNQVFFFKSMAICRFLFGKIWCLPTCQGSRFLFLAVFETWRDPWGKPC